MIDFDKPVNRKNTNCFKWDLMKQIFGKEDLKPFWVADMDFTSPEPVIKDIEKRLQHGVFGYPFRSENYFNSIIDWYKIRHNWDIVKDWIVNTPGVVPGICFTIQALTKPGDKILTNSPVYDPFFYAIQDNDRELLISPLINKDNHYEIDFTDMENQFSSGIKMYILCNPHNPVGRVWTESELSKIIELCLKYNVYLVSDEIHSDLVFKQYKHLQLAKVNPEISRLLILFNAPSKTFNIAGLATSYAIIVNEEIRGKLLNFINKNHLFMGNIFGITALESAYNNGQQWLDQLIDYLNRNYDYICKYLKENIPLIKPMKQEGTYLLWLDYRELGLSGDEMKSLLIEDAGLAITDGRQYGKGGDGYLRLNFGCPRAYLQEALDILGKVFVQKV